MPRTQKKHDAHINLKLPSALLVELDKTARKRKKSRSAVLREAIDAVTA